MLWKHRHLGLALVVLFLGVVSGGVRVKLDNEGSRGRGVVEENLSLTLETLNCCLCCQVSALVL
jgi:hypothetical protein